MKKSEFKKLIKESVRECIYEVLIESGAVSNIVAEVMKGVNTAPVIVEQKVVQSVSEPIEEENSQIEQQKKEIKEKLQETRKNLLDAIGNEAYGGVDLFEGTTPAPSPSSVQSMSGLDANDPGVDISGIMKLGGKAWKESMKKGKRR